jgi:hypothetical protein
MYTRVQQIFFIYCKKRICRFLNEIINVIYVRFILILLLSMVVMIFK